MNWKWINVEWESWPVLDWLPAMHTEKAYVSQRGHCAAAAGAFWHHSCIKSTSHGIFIKINKKAPCVDKKNRWKIPDYIFIIKDNECGPLLVDSGSFLRLFPPRWSKPPAASASAADRLQRCAGCCGPRFDTIAGKPRAFESKWISSENGMNLLFSELSKRRRREACVLEWVVPNALYSHFIIPRQLLLRSPRQLGPGFDSCRATFIQHVISFPSSFIFLPLSLLFMTPRWGGIPILDGLSRKHRPALLPACFRTTPPGLAPVPAASLTSHQEWMIRMPQSIKKK